MKNKYQVIIGVKEQAITAFADTGADISIMSKKTADHLNLPLTRTTVQIKPYGSKNLKCVGYYTGPIKYGDAVANISFDVVKKDLETLRNNSV